MPDINPSVPVVGQPDSTEEPKVVTALTQLIAAVNDVDTDQIADGTIVLADLAAALQEALPKAGNLRMTAKAEADTGWLMCDGSAVSRTTYSALYSAIGDAYGAGDGTTTFNLPDLQGRVPVGKGTSTDVDALGDSDGLAVASRTPKHGHSLGTLGLITVNDNATGGSAGFDFNSSAVQGTGTIGAASGYITGRIGSATGPTDTVAYLTVNYQIKT